MRNLLPKFTVLSFALIAVFGCAVTDPSRYAEADDLYYSPDTAPITEAATASHAQKKISTENRDLTQDELYKQYLLELESEEMVDMQTNDYPDTVYVVEDAASLDPDYSGRINHFYGDNFFGSPTAFNSPYRWRLSMGYGYSSFYGGNYDPFWGPSYGYGWNDPFYSYYDPFYNPYFAYPRMSGYYARRNYSPYGCGYSGERNQADAKYYSSNHSYGRRKAGVLGTGRSVSSPSRIVAGSKKQSTTTPTRRDLNNATRSRTRVYTPSSTSNSSATRSRSSLFGNKDRAFINSRQRVTSTPSKTNNRVTKTVSKTYKPAVIQRSRSSNNSSYRVSRKRARNSYSTTSSPNNTSRSSRSSSSRTSTSSPTYKSSSNSSYSSSSSSSSSRSSYSGSSRSTRSSSSSSSSSRGRRK